MAGGSEMDFCYDETELEERTTLDKLFNLENAVLYRVIECLCEYLHGTTPFYMEDWSNQKLVEWFETTYQYDNTENTWKAQITIH